MDNVDHVLLPKLSTISLTDTFYPKALEVVEAISGALLGLPPPPFPFPLSLGLIFSEYESENK